ncbi:activator-dependent family glycosyltransferase [Actinomadura rudentiformis]|uniref:Activator-dependent family glycosyltransferase n=1 Tax=Actinomadura rudentiformis TaxID=359158 RepID=A0A6H9YKN5_9ACTN|nr:activator-dependent family glycosyltransferase [Actinomadura rudentiformis]KAB2346148.1 activator-dependent family glycosyltransferase [Actinomadura rudentiformis]
MRVLCTTIAVTSHFFNMVPTAWALRAAGHDVVFASQPNLLATMRRSGLPAIPVGEPLDLPRPRDGMDAEAMPDDGTTTPYGLGYDIAETRPEVLTLDYVRGALAAYSSVICERMAGEAVLDDLLDFARRWRPDLVIWDAHTFTGPVVAKVCGAAHVRILNAPDHWPRMWRLFHELAAREESPPADPLADYLGGKLAPHGHAFDAEMVDAHATLDPRPEWMRPPLPGVDYRSVRFIPYTGPATRPVWLRRPPRRPRVCLTLGEALRSVGAKGREGVGKRITLPELLEAIASLDVEVVATLSADQLPPGTRVPDNVRLFDYFPLDELLPTCSAVVHHGGTGVLGGALVHGVPQLAVPGNTWGEADEMRRLAERGAGLVLEAGELTAEALTRQLSRLLTEPGFAESAGRLRKEMAATPSPHEIVPQLQELAARHTTPRRRPGDRRPGRSGRKGRAG